MKNDFRICIFTIINYVCLCCDRFLTYDPAKRITAKEAEDHDYFKEAPLPVDSKEFAAAHVADDTCHKISDEPSPKVQHDDDEKLVSNSKFHLLFAGTDIMK